MNAGAILGEDPASGIVVAMLQFALPPLVPGGRDYLAQLVEYFKRLAPAIGRGSVQIFDGEPPITLELDELQGIREDVDVADVAATIKILDEARRGRVTPSEAINAAIDRLGGQQLLDELAAIGKRCAHCGCTDERPCTTPVGAFGTLELMELAEYYAGLGFDELPERVPCSWIEGMDPPVCSAPLCRAAAGVPAIGTQRDPATADVVLLDARGNPMPRRAQS